MNYTSFAELLDIYVKGMTALVAMKGKLTDSEYATMAEVLEAVKENGDRAHYAEWAKANPWYYNAYIANAATHEPEDYGYRGPEWPDF